MSDQAEEISVAGVPVTVLRSAGRRRTVSLELVQGRYLLRAPLALPPDELAALADRLLERHRRRQRGRALNGDGALAARAAELDRRYFDGRLAPFTVRYVTNQRRSYGSCTPSRRSIRISDGVADLPDWVRDYVLVHELAHLLEANHGPRFWGLVARYPLTERARGYLMALGLEGPEGDEAGDVQAGDVWSDGDQAGD